MKKRNLIIGALSVGTLLLGACEKDEANEPKKPVTVEKKEEKEKKEEMMYNDIVLNYDASLKETKLAFVLKAENTNEERSYKGKNGEMILVTFTNEKDEIIVEREWRFDEDVLIPSNETSDWSFEFDAKGQETIKFTIEWKTKEGSVIQTATGEVDGPKVTVKEVKPVVYTSKVGSTLSYRSSSDEKDTTEHYQYSEDGYMQTKNNVTGTNVYYADEKGLYLVYNDPSGEHEENIISSVKQKKVETFKSLLVPYGAKTGYTWSNEQGEKWKVESVGDAVKLTNGSTYSDTITLSRENGKVIYVYSEKVGLLKVETHYTEKPTTVLELK